MDELTQALGILAESALIFFRAALGAGATVKEATAMLQAYIAVTMFGNGSEEKKEKSDGID